MNNYTMISNNPVIKQTRIGSQTFQTVGSSRNLFQPAVFCRPVRWSYCTVIKHNVWNGFYQPLAMTNIFLFAQQLPFTSHRQHKYTSCHNLPLVRHNMIIVVTMIFKCFSLVLQSRFEEPNP